MPLNFCQFRKITGKSHGPLTNFIVLSPQPKGTGRRGGCKGMRNRLSMEEMKQVCQERPEPEYKKIKSQ